MSLGTEQEEGRVEVQIGNKILGKEDITSHSDFLLGIESPFFKLLPPRPA